MGKIFSKDPKKVEIPLFKNPITTEEKIKMLQADQLAGEQVSLNISGEVFVISKNTIQLSKYDSYFKTICKGISTDEIFVDRSSTDFEIFVKILRLSALIKYFTHEEHFKKIRIIQDSIKDVEIFRDDLRFYFKKDFDEVVKDFNLSTKLQLKDQNSLIIKFELEKEDKNERLKYMNYKAKDIKELQNINCQRGLFMEKNGSLILELSNAILLKRIEVRPFIRDQDYFNVNHCKGVKIYSQNADKNWKYVGFLTFSNYTGEWISTLLMHSSTSGLKLTTEGSDEPLAISYIKIY